LLTHKDHLFVGFYDADRRRLLVSANATRIASDWYGWRAADVLSRGHEGPNWSKKSAAIDFVLFLPNFISLSDFRRIKERQASDRRCVFLTERIG